MLYVITYDIRYSNDVADKLKKYSPYDTIGAVIYKNRYMQKLLKTSTPITDISSIKDEYCTIKKATIEDVERYVIDGPGREETIEFLKSLINQNNYFKVSIYDDIHRNCKHIMYELYKLGKDPKLVYAKEKYEDGYNKYEVIICINSINNFSITDRYKNNIILNKCNVDEEILTFDFEFENKSFDDQYWVGLNEIRCFTDKVHTLAISIKDFDLKSPTTYRISFILTDENKNIFEDFYNDNKSNIKIL